MNIIQDQDKIAHLLRKSPDELMSPEERAESNRVLEEMARARRQAHFEARFVFIG